MESQEFSRIRKYLGKTQSKLARLLCISTKSVQSFEQGWRNIPPHIERQLLYLLSLYRYRDNYTRDCWEILQCPAEWRSKCAAWELKTGKICWFVNGTMCHGTQQKDWFEKIELCRQCEVFKSIFPEI